MLLSSYDAHPSDFWILLKPRVMSLSIFTAFCGMLLAPGFIHPVLGMGAILCIAMGAGAAGCLNMWCEIHRDALMKRTQSRPLPAGRVDPDSALAFGGILAIFSVCLLGLITNWVAAFTLLATILMYVFVYTLILKPRTPHNIVIGGASGALPPLIGWVCVTGQLDAAAWILFLIIFFWTPAHFWALCLEQSDDYDTAGFPMMPAVLGVTVTRRAILRYTFLTVATSLLLVKFIPLGVFYISAACVLGAGFLYEAYRVFYQHVPSRRLFFISIAYLFFLFLAMIMDYNKNKLLFFL